MSGTRPDAPSTPPDKADTAEGAGHVSDAPRSVLNVGGGHKSIPIPPYYDGWTHVMLDIDPAGGPDIVCDARKLEALPPAQFDAVYCSHNLEHYYRHDGRKVLRGFLHVLKCDGFAEIRVPDLNAVMRHVVEKGLDVDDILYRIAGQSISVRDVIYGWEAQIEASGVDFYAHKTGFTEASVRAFLLEAGFGKVLVAENAEAFELCALAFKQPPTQRQLALFGF